MAKKESKAIVSTLAFVGLVIFAALEIISVLNHFGIDLFGSTVMSILNTVKNLCLAVVVGVSAYSFILGKKKIWHGVYWACLIIFVAGTILAWF